MVFTEKDLEKKSLTEIEALIRGYEQKSMDVARQVGAGQAKPAEMMALNSDLITLKKALEKKTQEQTRMIPRAQPKAAAPLKSYEDYMKKHKHT